MKPCEWVVVCCILWLRMTFHELPFLRLDVGQASLRQQRGDLSSTASNQGDKFQDLSKLHFEEFEVSRREVLQPRSSLRFSQETSFHAVSVCSPRGYVHLKAANVACGDTIFFTVILYLSAVSCWTVWPLYTSTLLLCMVIEFVCQIFGWQGCCQEFGGLVGLHCALVLVDAFGACS